MKDRLYNADVKLEYMETQIKNEDTRVTVSYEFLKTASMEKELEKDVYAFNDVEISNLLKTMRRSNVLSVRKTLSILNDYVKWCIINGKRGMFENQLNYVDMFIKTESNLEKFVSNRQLYNKILNKEEFEDLLNIPVNPSDQALLLCLYEFIGGEELYELRSIEMKNIDEEANTIQLTDKEGNIRISKISNRLISLLKEANDEPIYLVNNGEANKNGTIRENQFIESKYVFKPTRWGDSQPELIPYQSVLNRMKKIKLFADYKHITANSIRETRIIHEILDITNKKELYEPNDEVYNEVVEKIRKDYNIELSHMQVYSIKQRVKQIVGIKDFT